MAIVPDTLRDEIEADLAGGELEDLFEDVTWGGHLLRAMVEIVPVVEDAGDMGGPILEAAPEFKFRRRDVLSVDLTGKTYGQPITYAGRTYDVDSVDDRPAHPMLVVRATLRP